MPTNKQSNAKRRNFAEEIKSKKSRLFRPDRWELIRINFVLLQQGMKVLDMFDEQIEYLEETYKDSFLKGYADDLNNYFPIRCVACIEGYVKLICSYLIEYGNPFRENVKKFDKISFSIDTAISLETNSIPLGDFVSHLLPVNNLEDINRTISTIIDNDLLSMCRESYKTLPRQKGFFGDDDSDFADMIKIIQNMYQVRHIFCHEVGYLKSNNFSTDLKIFSPKTYLDETWTLLSLIERVIAEIAPPKAIVK